LSALGARFFDGHHVILPPGGGALGRLQFIDTRFLDARLAKSKFTVLCDVSNPLHGVNGAAHIYAPQKGATTAQVEILDAGLTRLADVCAQTFARDLRDFPGSGAAGGTAFGLMTFLGAEMRSGIEAIMETTGFQSKLRGADLVLTGEGALDEQTLRGKVVAGVCRVAREHNVPVIGLAGRVALSGAQMDDSVCFIGVLARGRATRFGGVSAKRHSPARQRY
jgi:glycerate kinase